MQSGAVYRGSVHVRQASSPGLPQGPGRSLAGHSGSGSRLPSGQISIQWLGPRASKACVPVQRDIYISGGLCIREHIEEGAQGNACA